MCQVLYVLVAVRCAAAAHRKHVCCLQQAADLNDTVVQFPISLVGGAAISQVYAGNSCALQLQLENETELDGIFLMQRDAKRRTTNSKANRASVTVDVIAAKENTSVRVVALAANQSVANGNHGLIWTSQVWFCNCGVIFVLVFALLASFATDSNTVTNPRPTESWNGFRAFVAIWIFCEHCGMPTSGGAGAFVVLSGAVLTLSDKKGVHSVGDYLDFQAKRFARILPAYWVYMSFQLATGAPKGTISGYPLPAPGTPWDPFIELVTMPFHYPTRFFCLSCWTGYQGPVWFVPTIAWLYLFYPFLARGYAALGTQTDPFKALAVFIGAYLAQFLLCCLLWMTPPSGLHQLSLAGESAACENFPRDILGWVTLVYQNPLARLPEFVMGSMVTHLMVSLRTTDAWMTENCHRLMAWATDICFFIIVLTIIMTYYITTGAPKQADYLRFDDFWWIADRMDLVSIVWAFWLFGLAFGSVPSYTRMILQTKYALWLGNAAYGIYLWSFYNIIPSGCYHGATGQPICPVFNIAAAFCGTAICAFISFYFLEEPISNLVRKGLPSNNDLQPTTAKGHHTDDHNHATTSTKTPPTGTAISTPPASKQDP